MARLIAMNLRTMQIMILLSVTISAVALALGGLALHNEVQSRLPVTDACDYWDATRAHAGDIYTGMRSIRAAQAASRIYDRLCA